MDLSSNRKPDTLVNLLESDPGRFDPVTAFRVAQTAANEEVLGGLEISTPMGVSPVALPVSGYRRRGIKTHLRSAFASLTGPLGSMPTTYNELIMREERNRSRALASFFDIFSARMAELFADACEKYRIARRMRWGQHRDANGFITALFALTGFGTKQLKEKSGIDADTVLRFSGFFASRNRNASNLRAMLAEMTGLPVRIELFRPRWLTIPVHERSRLGKPQGLQLGVDASAGTAIHDFGGGFRVVLGPVGYKDYLSLAPGSANITELFALTRLYVGSALDFDIQIVLSKDEIPLCQLGTQAGDQPRLGWNSWARVAPATRDSDDAVIIDRPPRHDDGGEHAS